MNKYKSDIAESAANMMQIPDTLEGLLQDIHGQKEVESPVAENTNLALPETLTIVKKNPKGRSKRRQRLSLLARFI